MSFRDQRRAEPIVSSATQARFLRLLYGSGGAFALVAALITGLEPWRLAVMAAIGIVALVVSALLVTCARHVREWQIDAGVAVGCGLIAILSVATEPIGAPFVFLNVWVALMAALCSTPRRGVVLLLAAAASPFLTFGSHLWVTWTAAAVTEFAVATLVVWLRRRIVASTRGLRDAARTDGLTDLLNRSAFRDALDVELERGRRTGRGTALVLLDVDHFKHLNDRLGHAAGDRTLQRIAGVLRTNTRAVDVVGRVGGEEFAVMLVDLDDLADALALAERLLDEIRKLGVDGRTITASAGVALAPLHASAPATLVRAADRALYAAKSAGRDRVRSHDGTAESHVLPSAAATGAYLGTLLGLAESFDLRFSGHSRHSETVGRYAATIATELGWPPARVHRIRQAGVLHDVGKVCVPRAILEKPGPLDAAEWEIMRRHPELGAQMLDEPALDDIRSWVLDHHERPDGRGYPAGKTLEEIPLGARILSVADAYEAMTSDRPYRRGMPESEAIAELLNCAGTHFDAGVVEAFAAVLRPAVAVGA